MRRFITASDVELVYLTGQRTMYVDENDVVTSIAREMASKLGVKIAERESVIGHGDTSLPPPSEASPPSSSSSPNPSSSGVNDKFRDSSLPPPSTKPWIPQEFKGKTINQAVSGENLIEISLRNGRIVWPGQGIFLADIQISEGKIVSIQKPGKGAGGEEIDISGSYVLPGIIDPHVHMGIFSPFERDIRDETKAGLWGGVTSLGCYLYEKDSYLPKLKEVYEKVRAYSSADVLFHLTIATEKHLEEIPHYVNEYGIKSFKIYMCGVEGIIPDIDDSFMRRLYEKLTDLEEDCTVCIHAENASLVRWATEEISAQDGMKTSVQKWSETHPAMAEEEAIRRAIFLTKGFDRISTYFVHVSTKGGIESISQLKGEGNDIFAETTSPYLLFSIEGLEGNLPKWLPPLRNKESQEELWRKVIAGKVDSLGTDSVPMSREIKGLEKSVWEAMPNAPSMEYHLPGILTEGVVKRGAPMQNLVDLMTRRPAEIFGIFPRKGILLPGSDADIVVINMEKRHRVNREQIRSGTPFSLFEGLELTGWPVAVIKGGRLVIRDGKWITDPPPSKVLNEIRKK